MNHQITKFLIVGIINTMFYYILYSMLIYLHLDYKLCVLIATIFGLLFSFKTFGSYVFENRDKKLIYKFILVYLVLYILNIILIDTFEKIFYNYYISGLIAILFLSIFTFILNKYFVFKRTSK